MKTLILVASVLLVSCGQVQQPVDATPTPTPLVVSPSSARIIPVELPTESPTPTPTASVTATGTPSATATPTATPTPPPLVCELDGSPTTILGRSVYPAADCGGQGIDIEANFRVKAEAWCNQLYDYGARLTCEILGFDEVFYVDGQPGVTYIAVMIRYGDMISGTAVHGTTIVGGVIR